jgi:hypothetical protein
VVGNHGVGGESRGRTLLRPAGIGLVLAAAVVLGACGGPGTSGVASLGKRSAQGGGSGTTGATEGGGTSTTTPPNDDATQLLNRWTTCMRSHGDPNQSDPTIDVHWVINITVGTGSTQSSAEIRTGNGACSQYLAAARNALRAAHPVAPPPDRAELLQYVNCMRANGFPGWPDPPSTGDKVNFNGTGVTPTSPAARNATKVCGEKLGLPAWWIAGTGPPGDVSIRQVVGGPPGPPPSIGSNTGA